MTGNIFNADRDNNGVGIEMQNFLQAIELTENGFTPEFKDEVLKTEN